MNKKANLFVVGAMRSGTTSLFNFLSHHPQIYAAPIKEPNYFVDELPVDYYTPLNSFDVDHYFDNQFPKPVHITRLTSEKQYSKLFSLASHEDYRMEASTSYLHSEETPKRIHNYNSNAKVIILLRDPLKRTLSHIHMNRGLGKETACHSEIITQQLSHYNDENLAWHSYLGMSFYDSSIDRYRNQFDEVLIVSLENLANQTQKEAKRITDFLEIDVFPEKRFDHLNASRKLLFPSLFDFMKRTGIKNKLSGITNRKLRRRLFRLVSTELPTLEEYPLKDQEMMEAIFKKESSKYYRLP